jgi:bla regulator protein blaR1
VTPVLLGNLLAYSCALSLIAIGAWLAAAWSRNRSPRLLLAHFQLTLAVGVVLPLWSLFQPARTTSLGLLPIVTAVAGTEATAWTGHSSLTLVVTAVLAGGIGLRLVWLAIGGHRLRSWRRAATPLDPVPETIATIERQLDVRARWFVSDQLTSAATYGVWHPIVLLPARDLTGPAVTLQMVVRHELQHVRRRDWAFVVAEECLQAVLWFHPAVWFLVDRISLHREQVVDEAVVNATLESRDYVRALVAGAGLDWIFSPGPASHWLRARHLRQRIQAIVNGGTMSTAASAKWACVFAIALIVSGYAAVRAFPLQGSGRSQNERHVYDSKDPGVELPKVVREVKPEYTREAIDAHIEGRVELAVVIEADGSVSDVEITQSLDPTFGLDDQAVAAAWQWRFRPATKDGKPVAVSVALQLSFLLK